VWGSAGPFLSIPLIEAGVKSIEDIDPPGTPAPILFLHEITITRQTATPSAKKRYQ